jgi:hypothetical protein
VGCPLVYAERLANGLYGRLVRNDNRLAAMLNPAGTGRQHVRDGNPHIASHIRTGAVSPPRRNMRNTVRDLTGGEVGCQLRHDGEKLKWRRSRVSPLRQSHLIDVEHVADGQPLRNRLPERLQDAQDSLCADLIDAVTSHC